MELVLVSNYLNAHMKPLCEAFMRNPSVEKFTFVAPTASYHANEMIKSERDSF